MLVLIENSQSSAWEQHNVHYEEIPGKLCGLTLESQQLKQEVDSGETGVIDSYVLIRSR